MPITWPNSVNMVRSVSFCAVALATPKSITFGTALVVVLRHQHVGGLEIAMNDPLLMGVLHGLADRQH